jgi:Asp-tRNA(Asn)/Glu-tRNA(Gln) amidotransferase C subunit
MKSRLLLPLCLAGLAHAQVYTPPPASKPAPAATPTDTAPAAEKKQPAAGPLGQEIPMLDPAAETITVGGVAIPLGDNRLLKARFEKYLSQPPESDESAEKYRETIANILATISPFRSGGPDLYAAFTQLPGASAYPGDANLCGSLAESIYMAMLAKQDVNGLKKLNLSIEEEKKAIILEGDWKARHERDKDLGETKDLNDKKPKAQPALNPGAGVNSLKYADTLRRIAEIETLKKANIIRTEAGTLRTKAQYQVSMIQWFVQRRYEHVLMAARFYNQIWKDGDATLRVDKDSDVSKLFSESVAVSPTVASLDSLSNEAIRETAKYIEAFDLMLSRDELHNASQRLMEAYALGEYLAPVATLSLEKKRRVAEYVRDLHELYGTLQAHDYTKTMELAARLKTSAKDFPSSKVDSAIAAYTLASDLAIEEAKGHLLAKESDKAAAKIQAAAEIWPTNPKLKEFRNLVSNSGGLVMIRNDFDRLLSEGNFREVARRQYEIAPAIQGDATREDAFKQIMTSLTKIETALGKASEFSKMGQDYAAWEQLAKMREDFPDDPKLGRELEQLAPKVADFTRALDKARQFENRTPKQIGSALSWYLKARSIYPQSNLADAGAKRLTDEILPPDDAGTAAKE